MCACLRVFVIGLTAVAIAQPTIAQTTDEGRAGSERTVMTRGLLESATREMVRSRVTLNTQVPPQSATAPARRRSKTRIVLGAAAGAAGGFFAGGFLGAKIEGDRCNCDDPGLVGFLIGAPVGAVAGGIVGGKWLF
jgi:hypothetical protein